MTAPAPQPAISVTEVFSRIPNLKQGVAYDIEGSTFDYFTTVEILDYAGFSLSGGYSTSDKIVASLDYDLLNLKKIGVNTPLLDLIDLRIGAYVGIGNISTSNGEDRNKVAWGPEVTIVSVRF